MLDLYVGAFLLASFFFGAFSILILFSTYTILASGISKRGNLVKAAITITMYVMCAGHLGTSLAFYGTEYEQGTWAFSLLEQSLTGLPVVNYIFSDAVVVWRCWLLWGRRWRILIVPFVLFLGTIATTAVALTFDLEALAFYTSYPDQARKLYRVSVSDMVLWGLTLATNMWATSLVAYKAWRYRRSVRAFLGTGNRKTQVERLMALLVESGALYCFIWVMFLMFSNLTSTGNIILTGVMPQIASYFAYARNRVSIQPILIVLANFGKTHFDTDFAHGDSTGLDTFVAVRRGTAFTSEGGVSQIAHVDLEHGNRNGSGGGEVSSERKDTSSIIYGASGMQDVSEKEQVSIA
ncbi:uncharacterized protein STEHIDRAFT_164673 [Stereum hirsutum FP-91666 SS1]|uniref:uncharacterized protein n=1 Tax=Stereum hirsutum (strain FP-91666) TaxID=721885 RepID=UPI000440F0AD|nr:uncharacterized protein STEHIDRAFT_164673 [Stereum hirsutum FP-91666 SS1]EIM92383.1 hypothetical protein STEHIDRAFT_164673 [Stereum hirsutum FP-91666 SS1]